MKIFENLATVKSKVRQRYGGYVINLTIYVLIFSISCVMADIVRTSIDANRYVILTICLSVIIIFVSFVGAPIMYGLEEESIDVVKRRKMIELTEVIKGYKNTRKIVVTYLLKYVTLLLSITLIFPFFIFLSSFSISNQVLIQENKFSFNNIKRAVKLTKGKRFWILRSKFMIWLPIIIISVFVIIVGQPVIVTLLENPNDEEAIANVAANFLGLVILIFIWIAYWYRVATINLVFNAKLYLDLTKKDINNKQGANNE